MELVCFIVLAFASSVTATPHAYGIKGGAAARADASAMSGALGSFGEVPLSIPNGGGYSGGYSKSASSSFASSSASASSSAFSYSGSGAVPGYGGSGVTKCSGNCPTGDSGALVGQATGNIGPAYSGAKAVAGSYAGGALIPGSYGGHNTPCTSGVCNNNKLACQGPDCKNSSGDDKKCPSGNCGSGSQPSSPGYGTDDIPVFITGSAGQSSYDKSSSTAGSSCTDGKCEPSSSFSKQTSHSPDASQSITASFQIPSTSLVTPKEEAPCTTPNCGSYSDSVYDKNKPSSYNVPISGGYSNPKAPCTTANCGSSSPGSYNCAGGNCAGSSPTQSSLGFVSTSPSFSKKDYPNFLPLAEAEKLSTPSTISPSNYPGYVNASLTAQTNAIAGSYANASVTPTTEKVSPYRGGFGGPAGILKPNEYEAPSKIPSLNNKPATPYESVSSSTPYTPSQPIGSFSPAPVSSDLQYKPTSPNKPTCTSGNCNSSPQYGISDSYKPTGSYTPSSSPSGPSECLSGKCDSPSSGSYKPTKATGSYNPSGPQGTITSTGCTSGNCESQPSQSPPNYGSSASYKPTAPVVTYKPSSPAVSLGPSGIGASAQTGCTSGNCGTHPSPSPPHYGQSGSYKPTNSLGSYSQSSSGSYNPTSTGPSSLHTPTACSSGNCGSQPSYASPTHGASSSYKPSGPVWSDSPTGPSGSYGTTGCSSGNCGSQPTQTTAQYRPYGSYEPTGTQGCSSGNCGPYTVQSPPYNRPSASYKPSIPARPSAPTGCSSGYCAPSPSTQTQGFGGPSGVFSSTGPIGTYNPSSCTSGNCGPQSSKHPTGPSVPSQGFGGPSGLLSPTGATGTYYPTSCAFGNCGSKSSEHPIGPSIPPQEFEGPSGLLSSTGPTGTYNPSPCPSGNCVPQSSVHPIGPAAPTQVLGGPSGVLSPTNNPSPCTSGNCGPQSSVHQTGPSSPTRPVGAINPSSCSFGICGVLSGQGSSSSSQSGSHYKPKGTVPAFGGPSGLLSPNDFNTPSLSTTKPLPAGPGGTGSVSPTGLYNKPACAAGNCDGQADHSSFPHYGQSGTSGSQATAGAASSASAVLYTGGFGGPPGLLKPFDDGKNISPPSLAASSPITGSVGGVPTSGIHSSYGKSLNAGAVGVKTGAQSSAIAGSSAVEYEGNKINGGDANYIAGGCNGGCGANGGYGSSGASSKSVANAVSNASGGAYSGSFASSSASAHASAGTASKGGYGKR